MNNPITIVAIGFFLIGLSYIGNGTIGLFMPGPKLGKIIVLILSYLTAIGCFGLCSAILTGDEGRILGLDLIGWFMVFIAAQGVGTWALVIYRVVWVYRNWGGRANTNIRSRNMARDVGRDQARDPVRDEARDKAHDEWSDGDGR